MRGNLLVICRGSRAGSGLVLLVMLLRLLGGLGLVHLRRAVLRGCKGRRTQHQREAENGSGELFHCRSFLALF